jgi:hypothetical protein
MSRKKSIDAVRDVLFAQLERLADPQQQVDFERCRLVNETGQLIVNTAKVEVEYAKVIKGATTLPFIEDQEGLVERPYGNPLPAKAPEVGDKPENKNGPTTPAINHPWRGLGQREGRLT